MEEQDEQYQAFNDWLNHYLSKRDIHVKNLETAFSDGINLIHLVEIISGESIGRYSKNPKFFGQKLDNVQVAINFIEKRWNVSVFGYSPMGFFFGFLIDRDFGRE